MRIPGVNQPYKTKTAAQAAEVTQTRSAQGKADNSVGITLAEPGSTQVPVHTYATAGATIRKTGELVAPGVRIATLDGPTAVSPGVIPGVNRTQPNPRCADVPGRYLVDTSMARGVDPLTGPKAVALAHDVAALFPDGSLHSDSMVEILVVDDLASIATIAASPSGRVTRRQIEDAMVIDTDRDRDFHRVYVRADIVPRLRIPAGRFAAGSPSFPEPGASVAVQKQRPRPIAPLVEASSSVHVGGHISISGEPPEAFLAAATRTELEKEGWSITPADDAHIWIYRVPDARTESYFGFSYATADRPEDKPHQNKFKIATGIGPAHSPYSQGGDDADLLWLGDEQGGVLDDYLRSLASPHLTIEDLGRYQGLVQKISSRQVFVGNVDRLHALTRKGFENVETDPRVYRKIISKEYNDHLLSLLGKSDEPPAATSYLLATSRGCTQRCAICASGGLRKFQFFSAPRVLQELEKIAADAATDTNVGPNDKIDVFFLDSNFNNNPTRIIELAHLYAASSLYGRFRFRARHNTVNGFLMNGPDDAKVPNTELIEAFKTLGIKCVSMGIDTYDDASTKTLKTNRFQLEKYGVDVRPTYTADELTRLLDEFERLGVSTKGFMLSHNPWVSDLDRIDAYFNILNLWITHPHFEVDARPDAIVLQPFAGSPVEEVNARLGSRLCKGDRFEGRSRLGVLDEMMDFSGLIDPLSAGDPTTVLETFRAGVARIRASAEKVLAAGDPTARRDGEVVLRKLISRGNELVRVLAKAGLKSEAEPLTAALRDLATAYSRLPPFDPAVQKAAFAAKAQSLIGTLPEIGPVQVTAPPAAIAPPAPPEPPATNVALGYPAEINDADPNIEHTVKDVRGYLAENLGEEVVNAAAGGTTPFLVAVGDVSTALEAARHRGWTVGAKVRKVSGYHNVFAATGPGGERGFVITRVNGRDRVLHVLSLLKLAGAPGIRVSTVGEQKSWKDDYLRLFQRLGYVPDSVVYGFANTCVHAILERNGKNLQYFPRFKESCRRKSEGAKGSDEDMAGMELQVLEFKNGERVWVFNPTYGDLACDVVDTLVEHGAKNISFIGTSGSLSEHIRERDFVVPRLAKRADGTVMDLSWLEDIPGAKKEGTYRRVSTPNLETKAWLDRQIREGVDITEVELQYFLDTLRPRRDTRFRAALVVSDSLVGEDRADMTEWGLRDLQAIQPQLRKVLDATCGFSTDDDYELESYQAIPIV